MMLKQFDDKVAWGANVQEVIETEDCKVMKMHDESGEGMMTIYPVFPGVFIMYNDFHMKGCYSNFESNTNLLCIDHCREGRIEMQINDGSYIYLEAGDLRVDRRTKHNGQFSFPLNHYHGMSICFQLDIAKQHLPEIMKDFPVSLNDLLSKYCETHTPFVIPDDPSIEHIFSELYNVPSKIKKTYFKIKVLELLLYLDALELSTHKEERPYFYKGQVEKIKAIHSLLTSDLTRTYTFEELAGRFDIALTQLKNCFKSVYGSPLYTYMKTYRMNYAAMLLKTNPSLKIVDIAGMVGYDNPSKFASAFKQEMGKTPLEYRKSFV